MSSSNDLRQHAARLTAEAVAAADAGYPQWARDLLDAAEKFDARADRAATEPVRAAAGSVACEEEVRELRRRTYNVAYFVRGNLTCCPDGTELRAIGDELLRLIDGGDPQ